MKRIYAVLALSMIVSLTVEIKAILVMSLIRALSFGFYYTFQM